MTTSVIRHVRWFLLLPAALAMITSLITRQQHAYAQRLQTEPTTVTVVTSSLTFMPVAIIWEDNVQFEYEPEHLIATADKAQYFSQERKVVLKGNVHITQNGETRQVETVTYLMKEGEKFKIAADLITTSDNDIKCATPLFDVDCPRWQIKEKR